MQSNFLSCPPFIWELQYRSPNYHNGTGLFYYGLGSETVGSHVFVYPNAFCEGVLHQRLQLILQQYSQAGGIGRAKGSRGGGILFNRRTGGHANKKTLQIIDLQGFFIR